MRRMQCRLAGAMLTMGLALAGCATPDEGPAPLAGDLLIRDVRVVGFAGEAADIREHAFILVRDGDIVAVRDVPDGLSADQVVEAAGLTLTPGLTDMHVHIWDEAELGGYLSYGVTRVRNMSGMPFHLDLIDRIEAGELTGPHLLTTGPILNSHGPNEQLNHQFAETADEARQAVAWQTETGFTRLKVYSNLTREAYEAIRDEAEARGLIVTGHTPEGTRTDGMPEEVPFGIGFDEILDDHFETIEHIESIVWHGLRNRHDEAAARALAREIVAAGVPVTPTLLAHHNLWLVAETDGAAVSRPGTELLNPFEQSTEADAHAFWAGRDPAPVAEDDAFYGRVAKIFSEEGVLMVAGTDAGIFTNIPGLSLAEEMGLLVRAGLSPFEALKTATYNPSVVFGTAGQDGCVEAGCAADLVLYACDPLAEIACVAEPEAVVRDGKWLSHEALLAMREAAAQADVARTQENLFSGLAAQGVDVEALAAALQ